jgi:sugar lactone lactonase YvrE
MPGAKEGIIVADGQGKGDALTQLLCPVGLAVDQLGTIYVVDCSNHRVMRWCKGATQGIIVVGGNGPGEQSNQLYSPVGLAFDRQSNLYIGDKKTIVFKNFILIVISRCSLLMMSPFF